MQMHKTVFAFAMALAALAGQRWTPVAYAAAQSAQANFPAADCSAEAKSLPKGTTRVYIALRNGNDGTGSSMANARDGSTVTAFDTILRCYSEGCTERQNSGKAVAKDGKPDRLSGTRDILNPGQLRLPHRHSASEPGRFHHWQRMEDPWRGKR